MRSTNHDSLNRLLEIPDGLDAPTPAQDTRTETTDMPCRPRRADGSLRPQRTRRIDLEAPPGAPAPQRNAFCP